MKVTVKKAEGLYHEFAIEVPADQIQTFIQARLKEIGKKVKLDGFRPGKAPMALLEKRYGESARIEALDKAVEDCTFKALKEKDIKPAMRPKVDVTKFDNDNVLEFTVMVETMPKITPADFSTITIEKPIAQIDEDEVKDALNRIAANYKISQPLATPRPAKMGDTVKMNFDGSSHGKKLPGMSAKGFELELGSNMFVDTFEQQLVGVNNGDKKTIEVNFPADYRHPDLAGQPATFEVEVLEVSESVTPAMDDTLAEKVGMKTIKDLEDAVRSQMQSEHDRVSRAKVKRALLDALDKANQFTVPNGMVEEEFNQIWNYHIQDVKKRGLNVEEAQKDDETKKEFQEIAERRVRLGLLMAEIGEHNKIQVTNQELQQAVIREAYNYRGQEQEVIKYYQKNPQAIAALRAPIFEEKVTDFILSKVTINEKNVSKEDLLRDPDDEAEETRIKKAGKKK